jgi:hypothetical protein
VGEGYYFYQKSLLAFITFPENPSNSKKEKFDKHGSGTGPAAATPFDRLTGELEWIAFIADRN